MNLRQLLHKPLSRWHVLGVIALAVAAWFALGLHRIRVVGASMPDEFRRCEVASVAQALIYTTNPPVLDGTSREFLTDLASLGAGSAWVEEDPPQAGDRKGCVRVVIRSEQGHALHMLLQDEYASDRFRFRLLSYRKTTERLKKEDRAFFCVAADLMSTTNSISLDGTTAEFTADLASILAWPTFRQLLGSAPGDPKDVVRLRLGNDHGQALDMELQEAAESGQFRLLSYRKIPQAGAANWSQPVRSETNRTSARPGSGR